MALQHSAAELVQRLGMACHNPDKYGSMSVSIYDTAWLAMIIKSENGKTRWLFPESFELLLHEQTPNGQWKAYSSDIDGILNTTAGLLALIKHQTQPVTIGIEKLPTDLESRISKARSQVETMLQSWDVISTRNVGFEIIVPALLEYLNQHGMTFRFPGQDALETLRSAKLAKFDPAMLYSRKTTSLLHSLEALIGRVDFDRVSHHVHGGSMMASPSSTAAYLINTTTWDDEAEYYLHEVVRSCDSDATGGVPCAFPTSIFELGWVSHVSWSIRYIVLTFS